jgi:hypothetical protein
MTYSEIEVGPGRLQTGGEEHKGLPQGDGPERD